jgi:hypothetical protein
MKCTMWHLATDSGWFEDLVRIGKLREKVSLHSGRCRQSIVGASAG